MVYQNGKAIAMSLVSTNEASQPSQDIYSTEETVIGRWIDGKPLYRKTIPVYVYSTVNARTAKAILEDPNINVVGVSGFVDTDFSANDSGRYFVPGIDMISSSNTLAYSWYLARSAAKLYIVLRVDRAGAYSGYAHVEYTKNTDQATIQEAKTFQNEINLTDVTMQSVPVTASISIIEDTTV